MALLKRIRYIAAKQETVAGTAEALTAAEGTMNVWDLQIAPDFKKADREKQGGPALYLPGVAGPRKGKASFKSHLWANSDTAPQVCEVLLPACGYGWTSTQFIADARLPDVAGSTQKTVTIGSFQNGRRKQVFGAMGNCVIEADAGDLAVASWEFVGKWSDVADTAIIAPTLASASFPLRLYNSAFALDFWAPKIKHVKIDLQATPYIREDISDVTHGLSFASVILKPALISIDPESQLVATKDVYGEMAVGSNHAFTMKFMGGGYILTLAATQVEILDAAEAEREGLEVDNINLRVNSQDLGFTFNPAAGLSSLSSANSSQSSQSSSLRSSQSSAISSSSSSSLY